MKTFLAFNESLFKGSETCKGLENTWVVMMQKKKRDNFETQNGQKSWYDFKQFLWRSITV